jgi:hypothetical protein
MSEYQYVAFRAIDAPVSEKNLAYMRKQSSRAKVTSWSFENEYHFGDFNGNVVEMLRRGYDVHLHYSNFGDRKLMIRFPNGLPNAEMAKQYCEKGSLHFLKDKQGQGGILCIEPYFEPGDHDDILDLDDLLDRLLPLRAEILSGDLRPLYLAHLAIATDGNHDPDEEKDAPIPAGLEKLTDAQVALTELYGLSEGLIAAAARHSPPLPRLTDSEKGHADWLQLQPEATKFKWLCQLMGDTHAAVRRDILAEYQKSNTTMGWPTIRLDRTIAEMMESAKGIQREQDRKRAEDAARQRARKFAGMAADPTPILRKTEELVKQRNLHAYDKAALLLADLREALAGTDQFDLAENHARFLKDKNPTLHHLTAQLRRQGFLKK